MSHRLIEKADATLFSHPGMESAQHSRLAVSPSIYLGTTFDHYARYVAPFQEILVHVDDLGREFECLLAAIRARDAVKHGRRLGAPHGHSWRVQEHE